MRVAVQLKFPNLLGILLATSCAGATRDTVRAQNRIEIAKDLLTKGEIAGAESEAKKALALDPRSDEAHNLLGLVHLSRARANQQLMEKADCLSAADAAALRAESDDEMRAAERELAIATENSPEYGEAWENRGVVAMYFHDWDRAIDMEHKALANLERLDSAPLARANLGWAYFQKGDLVHAMTELLQANQGGRYFCLGKYRLASVHFARKEWQEAADALAPVFKDDKLCPPLQEAQYLGGQTFLRLHDRDAAVRAFSSCVDMAPKSCQARECQRALAEVSP